MVRIKITNNMAPINLQAYSYVTGMSHHSNACPILTNENS